MSDNLLKGEINGISYTLQYKSGDNYAEMHIRATVHGQNLPVIVLAHVKKPIWNTLDVKLTPANFAFEMKKYLQMTQDMQRVVDGTINWLDFQVAYGFMD